MKHIDMTVQRVMTKNVVTVKEDDDLDVVERMMRTMKIRHLPVLRDHQVIGLITHRDFLAASVSMFAELSEKEKKEMRKAVPVAEIMKKNVTIVEPETTLEEACRLLIEYKYGCLPVIKNGQLVGIVTESDMVHLLYKLFRRRREREEIDK